MKITDLEVKVVAMGAKNCIFTRLSTDDGLCGCSETVMKRRSFSIARAIDEIKALLIGMDPTRIEDIYEQLYRDSFWVGGPVHATPISTIEIALWDLAGRSLGVPIYRLFGGPVRDEIPVYCHCAAGAAPEAFAANAGDCVKRGYRALKTTLPVFYGIEGTVATEHGDSPAQGYSGTRGSIARSYKETELIDPGFYSYVAEYFDAARSAVGPEVQLLLDCHGRLSSASAVRLCLALEKYDLLFVEEPVPPENPEALGDVSSRTSVPIASGERWATIYGARPYIKNRSVSVVQPDVVNCGGFSQARKIAAMAEAEYISVAPHNPNGPLATAANLQLCASIPNFLILETIGSESERELWERCASSLPRLTGGSLPVPTGPGLGIELDWEACDRYPGKLFHGFR